MSSEFAEFVKKKKVSVHTFYIISEISKIQWISRKKCIQTAKSLLKKVKKCGNGPYSALLELRNTPIESLGLPSHLLMGRRTRTVLPVKPSLLTPDKLKVDVPSILRGKKKQKKTTTNN